MNAPPSDLEIVKQDIAATKAKLEKAEQANDRALVLTYGKLLHDFFQEKQRLESSGIVLNLILFT
jgi:hypothetical protein